MTEKRYYYTDPLAAAWMAKHFGMQFIRVSKDFSDMSDYFVESQTGAVVPCIGPFTIDPDSLTLLKPRVGDYAIDTYGSVLYVKELKGDRAIGCKSELFDSDVCSIYVPRVLQRDGKPFFWPEREA